MTIPTAPGRPATPEPTAPPGWRQRSACLTEDPELFFPVGDNPAARKQTRQAKRVCRRCPVATQCADWAMQTRQAAGIWGGITEDDRRERVRQQDSSEAKTTAVERAADQHGKAIARMRTVDLPYSTIGHRLGITACLAKQAHQLLQDRQQRAQQGLAA